jgi:hypothetical protein
VLGRDLPTTAVASGPMGRASTGVNTVYLTRFRNYKNCFTTPNKNLGGGEGLRQINTCRKDPLQVNF